MMRSTIGAGLLALAIGLSACGSASPSTPAGGATGATTTSGGATAGDTGATTTAGGTTAGDTSATTTAGGTTAGSTVIDAAIADPRFSTLVSLLEATGLSEQLTQTGPFTIFAPTNEAFAALPAGTLEALAQDPSLLQSILLYHVAEGQLTSVEVAASTSATTQQGSPIEISAQGDTVTLNGTATVIETDITVGNGVIHVIDEVLLPPDVSLPAAG